MNYYKELRKDASVTREEKVQRIDAYLTSLAAPFRQAFGARRPHWRDLLGWIEEVEFQIPWTAVNRYSAMKRMWRVPNTNPPRGAPRAGAPGRGRGRGRPQPPPPHPPGGG